MARTQKPLPGKEAARRMEKDPESVCFSLSSFCTQFGFSPDELRQELGAGRLVAQGVQTPTGYRDVIITAGAFLNWITKAIVRKLTVTALARKVLSFVFSRVCSLQRIYRELGANNW